MCSKPFNRNIEKIGVFLQSSLVSNFFYCIKLSASICRFPCTNCLIFILKAKVSVAFCLQKHLVINFHMQN